MRTRFCMSYLLVMLFCLWLSPSASAKNDNSANPVPMERWNAYVAFINESQTLMEIFSRYPENLGTGAEPDIKKESALKKFADRVAENRKFLGRIRDDVTSKVIVQADASDKTDLDSKAKAFAVSVRNTMDVQFEAQAYYAARSHVDDGLAKGKQMHPKIMAAYKDLVVTYKGFSKAMREQERLNMEREIVSMREAGLKILPAALSFVAVARDIAAELGRLQVDASNVHTLDAVTFKPHYDALVKALADLQADAGDEKQVEREKLYKERMDHLLQEAMQVKAVATGIMEAVAKGKPTKEPAAWREDTPEKFMRRLNTLIKAYNSMVQIPKT